MSVKAPGSETRLVAGCVSLDTRPALLGKSVHPIILSTRQMTSPVLRVRDSDCAVSPVYRETSSASQRFGARTQKELKAMGPRLVMPGHCTGWKATQAFAREFPEEFVQSSVGSRLLIGSEYLTGHEEREALLQRAYRPELSQE